MLMSKAIGYIQMKRILPETNFDWIVNTPEPVARRYLYSFICNHMNQSESVYTTFRCVEVKTKKFSIGDVCTLCGKILEIKRSNF